MCDNIVVAGKSKTLLWAIDQRNRMPAKYVYDGLPATGKGGQAAMLALFQWFADEGRILNRTKFKSLGREGSDLFEFKDFQTRFLGDHRPGQLFVLAHGIDDKKDDDLRQQDIARAVRILQEHDAREKKGDRK